MIPKFWQAPRAMSADLARKYHRDIHPVLAQVLYNRGYDDPQAAYHFLYDNEYTIDPFSMKDMEKAIGRITKAIKSGEQIAVYGDFDADGVTATTLMMHVLRRLKANAIAYIPDRVDEGYGLNTPALESLAEQGVKLVITVDCGIRAVQEADDARALGLDMIITDHHSVGPELPDAFAIVNPQQEDCLGDKRIAGVGVAFMVARALLLDAWERNGRVNLDIYRNLIDELVDLVAIGTVADIMPLNASINRALVRQGLAQINTGARVGIQALLKVAGIKSGEVTAMNIGFGIGPRINAAGRLAHALKAYELLSAQSIASAEALAHELNHLNDQRQRLTRDAQARIETMLAENGHMSDDLFFAIDNQIPQGIVGLVAGRLTEAYYRPAVVVERGETESHASCRSIPEFHITQALDACSDLLVRHGGHAMAAGLTVRNENLPALEDYLKTTARDTLRALDLAPTILIDRWLDLRDISMRLVDDLSILEPTGHENQPPIFATSNVRVVDRRCVGSDKSHLKLTLAVPGVEPIDGIAFRMGPYAEEIGDTVDVAYRLEINEWQGRRNVQMNVVDIRPSEADA